MTPSRIPSLLGTSALLLAISSPYAQALTIQDAWTGMTSMIEQKTPYTVENADVSSSGNTMTISNIVLTVDESMPEIRIDELILTQNKENVEITFPSPINAASSEGASFEAQSQNGVLVLSDATTGSIFGKIAASFTGDLDYTYEISGQVSSSKIKGADFKSLESRTPGMVHATLTTKESSSHTSGENSWSESKAGGSSSEISFENFNLLENNDIQTALNDGMNVMMTGTSTDAQTIISANNDSISTITWPSLTGTLVIDRAGLSMSSNVDSLDIQSQSGVQGSQYKAHATTKAMTFSLGVPLFQSTQNQPLTIRAAGEDILLDISGEGISASVMALNQKPFRYAIDLQADLMLSQNAMNTQSADKEWQEPAMRFKNFGDATTVSSVKINRFEMDFDKSYLQYKGQFDYGNVSLSQIQSVLPTGTSNASIIGLTGFMDTIQSAQLIEPAQRMMMQAMLEGFGEKSGDNKLDYKIDAAPDGWSVNGQKF